MRDDPHWVGTRTAAPAPAEGAALLEHVDSKGRPKLRRECTYPLTGKACVSYVVTDLVLLRWVRNRFVLEEVALGFTPQEVMTLTEMEVAVAPNVRTME